jgi:hypothetical protein
MAATDMTKAGLEPGCLVDVLHPDTISATFSDSERERLIALREHNPWTFLRPKTKLFMTLEQRDQEPGEMPATVDALRTDIERNYDDAQQVRQARFQRLLNHYPSERRNQPNNIDVIGRFCLVQSNSTNRDEDIMVAGGDTDARPIQHAFNWDDDFDRLVEDAGGEVLDGWYPEAVFDLDTAERIELHISSPIITRSEDQGTIVNVLNDQED